MGRKRAVFAVKPTLAEALVSGRKRVEIRRLRPDLAEGDIIYVYATSPVQAIVGSVICTGIKAGSPWKLWRGYGTSARVSRAFLLDYLSGISKGYAIEVAHPRAFDPPVTLEEIRKELPGFHPPRSYRFIRDAWNSDGDVDRRLGGCVPKGVVA